MMNDEIIKELHEVKDNLAAEFNYDLRLMFADIKRGEAELIAAGFNLTTPPINPDKLPETALQRIRFPHNYNLNLGETAVP